MNDEHVIEWIGRYLDGELEEARLSEVERHLAGCPECQTEADAQRQLSALLQAYPSPKTSRTARQASAGILAKLPPAPAQPAWKRALRLGWQFTPLVLVVGWAYSQTVLLISNAALLLSPLLPGLPELGLIITPDPMPGITMLSSMGGWFFDSVAHLSFISADFLEFFLIGIACTIFTLVLFAGWMATWWVTKQSQSTQ